MIQKEDVTLEIEYKSEGIELRYLPTYLDQRHCIEIVKSVIVFDVSFVNPNLNGFVVSYWNHNNQRIVIDEIKNLGNKLVLEVSDELQDMLEGNNPQFALLLEGVNQGDLSLYNGRANVEYEDKLARVNRASLNAITNYKAGDTSIDLSSRSYSHTHKDLESGGSLNIALAHKYNSLRHGSNNVEKIMYGNKLKELEGLYKSGSGWKLNLEQYLIKDENGNKEDIYIYIDENGAHINFKEKYTYKNGNKEETVTEDEVEVYSDGSLYETVTGNKNKVKKKLITESGLELEVSHEDLKNAHILALQGEELEALKKEKKQLDYSIETTRHSIDSNKKQLIGYAISKELKEIDARLKEEMVVTNENTLRFINLLYEIQARYLKRHRETDYLKNKEISEEMITQIYQYPERGSTNPLLNEETFDSIEAELIKEIGYLLTIGTVWFEGSADQQTRTLELDCSIYKKQTQEAIIDSLCKHMCNYLDVDQEGIRSLLQTSMLAKSSLTLLEIKSLEWQIESLARTNVSLNSQLKDLIKESEKNAAQIKQQEEQIPLHYLKQSDGSLLGFAKTDKENIFRLSAVIDNNDNVVYLIYKDNKLEKVIDKDSKGIYFEYSNDKLASVVNREGKKIYYEYEEDKLVRIRYGNNRVSEYFYDNDGYLVKVFSSIGYGHEYIVNNGRIEIVKEISKIQSLDKDGVVETTENVISEDKINYLTKRSVEIVNEYQDKIVTYHLDNMGKVISVYKNRFTQDGSVGAIELESYTKTGKEKSLEVISKKGAKELLEGIGSENESECYLGESYLGDLELVALTSNRKSKVIKANKDNPIYELVLEDNDLSEIKNSKNTQYVLSGFAKADSGYIVSSDDIETSLEETFDSYRKQRKYELRVVLEYFDQTKEFAESFDYKNKEYQYTALGVTIDNKESLQRIRVIFDYTNNIGEAEFAYMSFKEGEYEYKEYDKDERLVYLKNKDYDSDYLYEDDKLVKVITHKKNKDEINVYEYDDNDRLIRVINDKKLVVENKYNDKGQIVKKYRYHLDNPGLRVYESEVCDKTSSQVNVLGDVLSECVYSDVSLTVESIGADKVSYSYNEDGELVNYSVGNTYNKSIYEQGVLVSQQHNDFAYNYAYDSKLRLDNIKINDDSYLDIEYQDLTSINHENKTIKTGELVTYRYSNDDVIVREYNKDENLVNVRFNNENILDIEYTRHGDIVCTKDYLVGSEDYYEYDDKYNLVSQRYISSDMSSTLSYQYDEDNKLIKESFMYLDINKDKSYVYDENENLEKVILSSGLEKKIIYDDLQRIKEIRYGDRYRYLYSYLTQGDHTTDLVEKEIIVKDNRALFKREYKYDDRMNIIQVLENSELINRYEYDGVNRLVREDNKKLNKTITYHYDNGGNIENKKEYDYSLEDISTLQLLVNDKYEYAYEGNKDRLMAFNNFVCDYDALGRPTLYKGISVEWNKGNMSKYGDVTYTYNMNGCRVSKTYSGVTTKYHYNDSKLLLEDNGNLIVYEYDENEVVGFHYKDIGEYHYLKNIQGDIIGILDSNNRLIVKYEYEGYGKHKTYVLNGNEYVDINTQVSYSEDGLNNKLIAKINPFRYRSYYYDTESELYYLITRYYDPNTGRFISIDSIEYLDKDNLNGLNLYVYCLNNPIMLTDSTGSSAWTDFWNGIGGKIVGTILVVAAAAALTYFTSGIGAGVASALGNSMWGTIAGSAIGGAVSGAIIGGATSVISQGVTSGYSNIVVRDVLMDAAISGAIGGFFGGLVAKIGYNSATLTFDDKSFFTRNLKKYENKTSKNLLFGTNGNFTIFKWGLFRIDSSLVHGFHMHLPKTKRQVLWKPLVKLVGWISGVVGAWTNSFVK